MEAGRNKISLIVVALIVTVAVPCVAGTLGCANEVGELSADNVSWILICSSIPLMFLAVINLIVISLGVYSRRPNKLIFGALALTSIAGFIYSFHFVDAASSF
jgi:hypothetical protein